VKWHLPSSSAAEHRGKTDKAFIREHKATWDYVKEIPLRLTIEKTQLLQECQIHFEILQEFNDGPRGGRVHLGDVRLNLAEYTHLPEGSGQELDHEIEGEEGGITRRYLMQDSKVNSTLKLGIRMKQTDGDTNFIAPPLKSAMVIGGIASVLTEAREGDDMPSLSSNSRDYSESQDIYRRTLAATWACQPGELPPDKLIEDLFAGGDGGRLEPPLIPRKHERAPRTPTRDDLLGSSSSDTDSRRTIRPTHLSPDTARGYHRRGNSSTDLPNSHMSLASSVSGRASIEQQMQHSHQGHRRKHTEYKEVTEFDLRDDLRSWQVSVK